MEYALDYTSELLDQVQDAAPAVATPFNVVVSLLAVSVLFAATVLATAFMAGIGGVAFIVFLRKRTQRVTVSSGAIALQELYGSDSGSDHDGAS